jgi:hypothetical protein
VDTLAKCRILKTLVGRSPISSTSREVVLFLRSVTVTSLKEEIKESDNINA